MSPAAHRYPLEPLLDAARATDLSHLAELLGITPSYVHRLRHEGLTEKQADHFAVRLGMHASWIWTDWWSAPFAKARRRDQQGRWTA